MAMAPTPIADVDKEFNVWPKEYEHIREDLSRMSTPGGLCHGDSWPGCLLCILSRVFPGSEPERYCPNGHYNLLRHAIDRINGIGNGGVHHAATSSHGTVDPGQHSDSEDKYPRPSLVLDHWQHVGELGQNMVLLIDVVCENKIDPEDSERFFRFCNAIQAMGPTWKHANILLIVGGKVYCWRYDDMPLDGLSNDHDDLEKVESVDVYDVKFWQLLGHIRDEYVEAYLKSD